MFGTPASKDAIDKFMTVTAFVIFLEWIGPIPYLECLLTFRDSRISYPHCASAWHVFSSRFINVKFTFFGFTIAMTSWRGYLCFQDYDDDKNGNLDFHEFLKMMARNAVVISLLNVFL